MTIGYCRDFARQVGISPPGIFCCVVCKLRAFFGAFLFWNPVAGGKDPHIPLSEYLFTGNQLPLSFNIIAVGVGLHYLPQAFSPLFVAVFRVLRFPSCCVSSIGGGILGDFSRAVWSFSPSPGAVFRFILLHAPGLDIKGV